MSSTTKYMYSWMNHVCTYVSEENERGNYAIKINSGKNTLKYSREACGSWGVWKTRVKWITFKRAWGAWGRHLKGRKRVFLHMISFLQIVAGRFMTWYCCRHSFILRKQFYWSNCAVKFHKCIHDGLKIIFHLFFNEKKLPQKNSVIIALKQSVKLKWFNVSINISSPFWQTSPPTYRLSGKCERKKCLYTII